MGKVKKLVLTLDIDNDFTSVPLEDPNQLKWDGLYVGLPRVLGEMNSCAKWLGTPLAITIFCRADWQIESLMGRASWVFNETRKVINELKLDYVTTDLQWHPHLYSKASHGWALIRDEESCETQLRDIYAKLKDDGVEIRCSRIGECYFNNRIPSILQSLSIEFDSTAFPGRNLGHTDWTESSITPYRMSLTNYKQEGNSRIWQVPFSMIPVKAPYESEAKLRYLNLIFSPHHTYEAIKNYSAEVFVSILHPYEVLTLDSKNKHQLFGGLDSIHKNIRAIFEFHKVTPCLLKDLYER